ncbi:MAG: hypothetical protein PHS96_06235 [Anaerolineales bacterium]|nr:hypothetical protein [Anaerolineales bacterium]
MEEKTVTPEREQRKPYARPEILHELELETRAGTGSALPDPLDLTGSNP